MSDKNPVIEPEAAEAEGLFETSLRPRSLAE